MKLHKIQKDILKKLVTDSLNEGLRYRDMKKKSVENDLYNYHLQYLVKENLIIKKENNYIISNNGKRLIDDELMIDPGGNSYDTFRFNILATCIKQVNSDYFVLNQERTCHPFFGDKGIIGGPILKGEKIIDAAKRKVFEETGVSGEFKHYGTIRKIRFTKDKEIFSDIIFNICVSFEHDGNLKKATKFGINFWDTIENAVMYESTSKQGSVNLAKFLSQLPNINSNEIFFVEESKILKDY